MLFRSPPPALIPVEDNTISPCDRATGVVSAGPSLHAAAFRAQTASSHPTQAAWR